MNNYFKTRHLFLKFLLAGVFFIPFQLSAQDITGMWKGTISTTEKELPYELAISEVEGKLTGYSYTRFTVKGKEMEAVKSIKVTNKNGTIEVEDDDLIYDNFSQDAARQVKQTDKLTLSTTGTVMELSGTFKTKGTRQFRPLSGLIKLQKIDTFSQTALAPALDSLQLLSSLSFLQPKIPITVFTASSPKAPKQEALGKPVINDSLLIAKNPVIQQPQSARKIIPEQVDEKPVESPVVATKPVASVVAPPVVAVKKSQPTVTKEVAKPVVAVAKPVAKPPVIPTVPPVEKPVAKTTVTGSDFTASLAKRKIETIETLEFKTDSLMLTLYDNGEVDGDTVSVILNGKILMEKQGLSTRAITKTIYITPEMGDSLQLVMYAENLGSLPPNSGLLIINDGKDRYEIRFAGDLQKNAGITLRRKK